MSIQEATMYRIDFSIKRAEDEGSEYTEIGFGGSTDQATLGAALYEIETTIQRREWETEPGMPAPAEVQS